MATSVRTRRLAPVHRASVLLTVALTTAAVLPSGVTAVPSAGLVMSDPTGQVVGPPTRLLGFYPDLVYATHPFNVVVWIADAGEQLVKEGTSATISLAIDSSQDPATSLACAGGLTLPTNTAGPNAGVAVFTGCRVDRIGSVVLIATASNVVSPVVPTPTLTADLSHHIPIHPATEAPMHSVTVRLNDSTEAFAFVTIGQPVTIKVVFGDKGANRPFQLQEAPRTTSTWRPIADLVTDAQGMATFTTQPDRNTFYRAVFAGAPDLPAGASPSSIAVVAATARQSPTHAMPRRIAAGTTVRFTTTVRPVLTGPVSAMKVGFQLYHRVDGRWRLASLRTRPVDANGVARINVTFAGKGEWYVRSYAKGQVTTVSPAVPEMYIAVLQQSAPTSIARFSVR